MKGTQVVLGHLWGREAAALMVDGRIEDLALDASALTPLPPGAVCRAVVDRLVKGQGGVFLRLPEGQRGFLREARGLAEGQSLIVQVTGVAERSTAASQQVSSSTEQTTASTREIADSAERLQDTAGELNHLIARFKL